MSDAESRTPNLEERVAVWSGLFLMLFGVANIAFGDRASYDFLGGALLVAGSALVFPPLVALAISRHR